MPYVTYRWSLSLRSREVPVRRVDMVDNSYVGGHLVNLSVIVSRRPTKRSAADCMEWFVGRYCYCNYCEQYKRALIY